MSYQSQLDKLMQMATIEQLNLLMKQFNNTNNLRQDEIYKVRDIIHSQNDIYKCINDDIKLIKNDCNLLRNKIIDNWEEIIYITKNLQNQINELKLNTNIEELKQEDFEDSMGGEDDDDDDMDDFLNSLGIG